MYPEQNYPMPPESQKPTYTVTDTAYAWLSLLMAFLFCQTSPLAEHPLGAFLLILGLFITGFVILLVQKRKLSPACILSALSSVVIGAAPLLTDTLFLIRLSMAYSLGSYLYFLYAAFGNRIEEGFSDYIYIDYMKVLILQPFSSLGAIFPALSNKSAKNFSGVLLKIIFGVAIAVIPTVVVFLFLSYDSDFLKLLDDIFSFELEDIGRTIRSLIFTLPLGMYGFGLYAAAQRKAMHDKLTPEICNRGLQQIKVLPQVTAVVAVLPILFLYAVFFISQWKYYVSGFTGVLPEDFSYAEYARRGFFELCSVSVINLVLIVGLSLLMKRGKRGAGVFLKILTTAFCLCTLVLISTAVAKLIMYIDSYGLTQKRIYAMWLMALIAIVFLLIALGQFIRKFKTVALCFTVAVVMFAGLAVCNVNALCAQYNADRYLSGTLETIDVQAMKELGDSAVPSLVRLVTEMDGEKDPKLKDQITSVLRLELNALKTEKASVFSFSIPSAQAQAALKEYAAPAPQND